MSKAECCHCQRAEDEVQLRACRICRKYFCDDHAVQRSGVGFCSLGCSVYFFHDNPDEEKE
jgi:hypothetical protein